MLRLLSFLFVITTLSQAVAQVPQGFKYQAVARNATGEIIASQNISVEVSLLEDSINGNLSYKERHGLSTNAYGLFTLTVGGGTVLSGNFSTLDWQNHNMFIRIGIDPSGSNNYTLFPAQQLLSVPYALVAGNGGGSQTGMDSLKNLLDIDLVGLADGQLLKWNANLQVWMPANDNVASGGGAVNTNARLSGDGSASAPLDIAAQGAGNGQVLKWNGTTWAPGNDLTGSAGSGDDWGSQVVETDATLSGDGTSGDLLKLSRQGANTGQVLKWSGSSWVPRNDTVGGGLTLPYSNNMAGGASLFSLTHNGTEYAMKLTSFGNAKGGLYLENQFGTGSALYILNDGSGNGINISHRADNGNGLKVYSPSSSTAQGQMVVFQNDNTGYTRPVLEIYNNSTSPVASAAYFDGKVDVNGNISKSGGSFKIDHPADPANKYLYHSFVESPDMMNIYNGNITTDANGYATVILPAYFDTLNRDFRYQLTCVGAFAQAIVKAKVQGGKFIIQTDKPNIEVSWMVTGIRKDPWAEQNRIPVEVDKPEGEKGFYIHPSLYGMPRDFSIHKPNKQ